MDNSNYDFWKMAFDMGAIDINTLSQAVKCENNPYGEISKEQFKEICKVDFDEYIKNTQSK